ncbi:hypothetical protein VIBC2010_03324 [Vibrio caribbeanicus ATCC BAA-2122]|uniref:Uncharacterized protein n=1 Tax=Vibrio caribbeanicus ATCC BAA-2122 TaxID=796620 RepID=E3BG28_9VIBR|nr:hypothetical protein VIBC2010_03324 [Vibrio caribbeanicus ATCC BAA-2122]
MASIDYSVFLFISVATNYAGQTWSFDRLNSSRTASNDSSDDIWHGCYISL